MSLLEDVYKNYRARLADGDRVGKLNLSPDELAIRERLPDFFRSLLSNAGHSAQSFKIYGGIGQQNFNRALVPWVAICNPSVTKTPNNGYYLVLLFHQEMSGCFLSLNQGYTQYKRAFGVESIAKRQMERSAHVCAEYLSPSEKFEVGPIDLGATHEMGRGYERGAIVSKWYPRPFAETDPAFADDLASLLECYDRLVRRVGPDIMHFLPPAAESDYQAAASEASRQSNIQPPPPGPLPPPPPLAGAQKGRYTRDYRMAAVSLKDANFQCEIDTHHKSFIARKTGRAFVEAHHLIPVSRQHDFLARLDVPENIVALCPNCHRLLHHGKQEEKRAALLALRNAREKRLQGRGLVVSHSALLAYYGHDLADDD